MNYSTGVVSAAPFYLHAILMETTTDTNPAHEALLSALSGSTSIPLSSTAEGQMGEVDESDAIEEQTATVLTSPPPTRPTSPNHDTTTVNATEPEKDLTEEGHPLEHTHSDSKDVDLTQDTTFVDPLESDEKHQSTPSSPAQKPNQSLRVDTKPPSPQPWDLVDPPHDNNTDVATDYYSSLGTKNFGTLQKMRCL